MGYCLSLSLDKVDLQSWPPMGVCEFVLVENTLTLGALPPKQRAFRLANIVKATLLVQVVDALMVDVVLIGVLRQLIKV
jgi:hypothetical protein